MSSFETVFSVWLVFISNLAVDIESQLLPPANPAEIMQLQEQLGVELPDDFVQLYLTANGQTDPYLRHKGFTGTYSPLFGKHFRFRLSGQCVGCVRDAPSRRFQAPLHSVTIHPERLRGR